MAKKVTLLCHLQVARRSWPKQPTCPRTRLGLDETGFLGGALSPHLVPQPSPSLLVCTGASLLTHKPAPHHAHPASKLLLLCAQRQQRWHGPAHREHAVPPRGGKASTLVITQLSKFDDKEPGLQKLTAKRTPRELVCLGDSRKASESKDGQIWMDMRHWREDQWPSKSQSRGHRRCVWRAVAAPNCSGYFMVGSQRK